MNNNLVRKNGGTVAPIRRDGESAAMCGDRYGNRNIGRSGWIKVTPGLYRVCGKCAEIANSEVTK